MIECDMQMMNFISNELRGIKNPPLEQVQRSIDQPTTLHRQGYF